MNEPRRISRLVGLAVVLGVVLLSARAGLGGTYYISYSSGANGNPGTKAQPWKYHPYMWGWSGSYTHSAGDRFIFKGGDTWPNDCFTFYIQGSGAAGNYDYYGVDQTWYGGSSWTKPHFDAQGIELTRNSGTYNVMVAFGGMAQHYIQFDNIDFTGLYWAGNQSFGSVDYIKLESSTYITISNCTFRNWSHASIQTTDDMLYCILGTSASPYTQGCIITDCLFDGETQANQTDHQTSGTCIYNWGGSVLNSVFRNNGGSIFTSSSAPGTLPTISGNQIYKVSNSYDSKQHADAIMNNGGQGITIANNYIYDCVPVTLFINNGSSSAEKTYIYNNVIQAGVYNPIQINTSHGGGEVYMYNNTIISDGAYGCIRVVFRQTGSYLSVLDLRNNHFITDGAVVAPDSGVSITTPISQNNVIQTQSQAVQANYTKANMWKPTSTGSPTYNVGQNLSGWLSGVLNFDIVGVARPQASVFDSGAYEFTSGQTFPGSVSFTASTAAVNYNAGTLALTIQRTGGSDGTVNYSWATADGTATAGIYYTASSGTGSFANGVTTPVVINIPILNSGITGTTKTFLVNLSGGNIGVPGQVVVTIQLQPTPPAPLGVAQWESATYFVDEAGPNVTLTAQRVGGSNGILTANYATASGSALPGHDYTSTSGTLTWPNGNTAVQTVTVPIIDSTDRPGTNRTFTVTLTGSSLGTPTTATVTIIMRQPLPPEPPIPPLVPGKLQFASPVYYTTETNGTFTAYVQRTGGTNGVASVDYATASGSAVDGTDFTGASGTLSWADGNNDAKPITVTIINSGTVSVIQRSFVINLSNAVGGSLGSPSSATVLITMNAPIGIRAIIGDAIIGSGIIGR